MLREAQVVGVGDDWDRLESPFVGKRSNQPMVKPCKTHNAESLVEDTPEVALAIPQLGYCWLETGDDFFCLMQSCGEGARRSRCLKVCLRQRRV